VVIALSTPALNALALVVITIVVVVIIIVTGDIAYEHSFACCK
jgi:hypothetical protein